ncbi:MAG: asparagine synthase (glutamine-hydrolyzing), partial [Gammaproteobacteria bacterium]|nr:asparagine synthase (glutamine-hydrolyzing) [Gammaproteobacteria bacterium]
MCGISGCYLSGGPVDERLLKDSIAAMRYRGPDEQGTFVLGPVGLAHARLSIIDISTGQQPMSSTDGRHVIVFNGEIYNFQELRRDCEARGYRFHTHSDTEVILALYAMHGTSCVERLRGMFAFAVYDQQSATMFLARDRLGVKPLLYAHTSTGFHFASEMPALLALAPELKNELDPEGLSDYFLRQYINAPRTAYRRIRKLEPGTFLVIKGGVAQAPARYWFPEQIGRYAGTAAQAGEELRARFTEATRLRLTSERPVGALLSGGTDSSITVAVMSKLLNRPVKTYSIGFVDEKWDERKYARQVAQHCGTDHEELLIEFDKDLAHRLPGMLRPFGEPYADNSLIPTFYVAQLARRGATVILTGDGADEAWAGYKRHYHAALLLRLQRYGLVPLWRRGRRLACRMDSMRGRNRPFPRNRLDRLLLERDASPRHLTVQFTRDEFARFLRWDPLRVDRQEDLLRSSRPDNDEWDAMTRFLYYEMNTFLAGDVLPKVDIATMLNSIEARSPFLDHRLMEFIFSLPMRYKLKGLRQSKWLLKETFKDLLPPGFFDRPK